MFLSTRTSVCSDSTVERGYTTSALSLPRARSQSASCSYVMSASPNPFSNWVRAARAEAACATTFFQTPRSRSCPARTGSAAPLRAPAPYSATIAQLAPPEVSGSGCTTRTPGLARSAKSRMFFGLPGRTRMMNGVRLTTPPKGSRLQLSAPMTPASDSLYASSSSDSSARCPGTPRMSWFVTVPDPEKELTSSTRSPVRSRQRLWNSGNTP